MIGKYILLLLQLTAITLAGLIPSNIPIIGAAQGGDRQPLTWFQTFWAVFWAILAASVIISIGFVLLFFVFLAIIIAAIEEAF